MDPGGGKQAQDLKDQPEEQGENGSVLPTPVVGWAVPDTTQVSRLDGEDALRRLGEKTEGDMCFGSHRWFRHLWTLGHGSCQVEPAGIDSLPGRRQGLPGRRPISSSRKAEHALPRRQGPGALALPETTATDVAME